MMKRIMITGAALFVAGILFGNLNTAQAADPQAKASTSEMPAALQSLGIDKSRVLTQAQAKEVRGEGRRSRRGRFGGINLNFNFNIINVVQNNVVIDGGGRGRRNVEQINRSSISIRN